MIRASRTRDRDVFVLVGLVCVVLMGLAPGLAADLVVDRVEMAGLSAFPAYWDKPVVVRPDGAVKRSDHGRFGAGDVADWSTAGPGAPVFDAVNRSLLVKFPGVDRQVAAELAKGRKVEKVELVLPFRDTELFPMDYVMPAGMSFLGDTWVKRPPQWHAVAYALRRPWEADARQGPTFNAWRNGVGYWSGGYEWATATGPRGILIGRPRLEVSFSAADAQRLDLPPAPDARALARAAAAAPEGNRPTAVMPGARQIAEYARQHRIRRPDGMADWQWTRLQELLTLGGKRDAFVYPDTPAVDVTYRSGADTLALTFNPRYNREADTTVALPARTVNGRWPYLDRGVERDTTLTRIGRTGVLEKNGAILRTEPGRMAYLQTIPARGITAAYHPFPEFTTFALQLPGGAELVADGQVGITRVIHDANDGRLTIDEATGPEHERSDDRAQCLVLSGMDKPPATTVNGRDVAPVRLDGDAGTRWAIPLRDGADVDPDRVRQRREAAPQALPN